MAEHRDPDVNALTDSEMELLVEGGHTNDDFQNPELSSHATPRRALPFTALLLTLVGLGVLMMMGWNNRNVGNATTMEMGKVDGTSRKHGLYQEGQSPCDSTRAPTSPAPTSPCGTTQLPATQTPPNPCDSTQAPTSPCGTTQTPPNPHGDEPDYYMKGTWIPTKDAVPEDILDTIEVESGDADGVELHNGPRCTNVSDCMEDCMKNLPPELCEMQRQHIYCESATGRCAATHFMRNGSMSRISTTTEEQGAGAPRALAEADDEGAGCSDCVCFKESVKNCAKTLIRDAVRCGKVWLETFKYHAGLGKWWGSVEYRGWGQIAQKCWKWGPCEFPRGFSGCMQDIAGAVSDDAKEFVQCAMGRGECTSAGGCGGSLEKLRACSGKLLANGEEDMKDSILQEKRAPQEVKNTLKEAAGEKENLVKDFTDDVKNFYRELRADFSKKSNWERGSVCTSGGTPKLVVDDCGAFDILARLRTSNNKRALFREAVGAFKKCGKQLLPFTRIEKKKKRSCFPRIVEVLHDKIKSNEKIQRMVRRIQRAVMRKFGPALGFDVESGRRLGSDVDDSASYYNNSGAYHATSPARLLLGKMKPVFEVAAGFEVGFDFSGLGVAFSESIGVTFDWAKREAKGFVKLGLAADIDLLALGWVPQIVPVNPSVGMSLAYDDKSAAECDTEAPECVNKFDQSKGSCNVWASQGECERNPGWMHDNCAASCKKCPEAPACSDKNANCPSWADRKFCAEGEWVEWMANNCAVSCKKCPEAPACVNKRDPTHCSVWASAGYCNDGCQVTSGPDCLGWMQENCAASCKWIAPGLNCLGGPSWIRKAVRKAACGAKMEFAHAIPPITPVGVFSHGLELQLNKQLNTVLKYSNIAGLGYSVKLQLLGVELSDMLEVKAGTGTDVTLCEFDFKNPNVCQDPS